MPNRQLGAKILSPDPLPIYNARPEPFTTTGFGYEQSNVMSQPNGNPGWPVGFSDGFSDGFANGSAPQGFDGDGPQMTMPDGTLMLMPDNPPGVEPI